MPLEINTLLLPDENDILLTDVSKIQFHSVKMKLEVQNGTETNETHKYPIQGVIMGLYGRMWIPLIVAKRNKSFNTIFLYDTGSPYTHISKFIFEKIGYTDNIPESIMVNIHGVNLTVYLLKNHFEHINLLGQDFMKFSGLNVSISYNNLLFQFNK